MGPGENILGFIIIPPSSIFFKILFPPGKGNYPILTDGSDLTQSQFFLQSCYQYLAFKTKYVPYLIHM